MLLCNKHNYYFVVIVSFSPDLTVGVGGPQAPFLSTRVHSEERSHQVQYFLRTNCGPEARTQSPQNSYCQVLMVLGKTAGERGGLEGALLGRNGRIWLGRSAESISGRMKALNKGQTRACCVQNSKESGGGGVLLE